MSRGYLLDTSVLSLGAPGRPLLPKPILALLDVRATGIYLSAITIVELQQGIESLRRKPDEYMRAEIMSLWIAATIEGFDERLLPFDTNCALEAGSLSDRMRAAGSHPGFADVAIAATAAVNELVVLTRNARHFAAMKVAYLDPLAAQTS